MIVILCCSPQAVIDRFERREHATDGQTVVEYLRALVATNGIAEYLPDERTGRLSGLPALVSSLDHTGLKIEVLFCFYSCAFPSCKP